MSGYFARLLLRAAGAVDAVQPAAPGMTGLVLADSALDGVAAPLHASDSIQNPAGLSAFSQRPAGAADGASPRGQPAAAAGRAPVDASDATRPRPAEGLAPTPDQPFRTLPPVTPPAASRDQPLLPMPREAPAEDGAAHPPSLLMPTPAPVARASGAGPRAAVDRSGAPGLPHAAAAAPPDVRIHIGRMEVLVASPSRSQPAHETRAPPPPPLSLDAYLKAREQRR